MLTFASSYPVSQSCTSQQFFARTGLRRKWNNVIWNTGKRRRVSAVVVARLTKEGEETEKNVRDECGRGAQSENGVLRERKRRRGVDLIDADPGTNGAQGRSRSNVSKSEHSSVEASIQPQTPADTSKSKGTVRLGRFFGKDVEVPGKWLLYTVPFMWGSFGPSVRYLFMLDGAPTPSVFNTERLLVSVLVYSPILFAEAQAFMSRDKESEKNGNATEQEESRYSFFRIGIELGAWVFLANVCQVIGLQQTSASRAAFFNQLQTVFVPVAAGIFGFGEVTKSTVAASLVALIGVALLSADKSHGIQSTLLGDALEVGSAIMFSIYILRLGVIAKRVRTGPLVATKIATQAALSTLWAAGAEFFESTFAKPAVESTVTVAHLASFGILVNVAVVAWTGLVVSAASGWVQTKGQESVSASEAAVIFATQPLWASALAAGVLGEGFGSVGITGGLLIVTSTLISARGSGAAKH